MTRAAAGPLPQTGHRPALSVVILTKDEEARIRRCLESVRWAEEIVVVDGASTDRTVDICREFGARVISHPFEGSFAHERNLGLEHARGDWVLQIDADDVVTPAFREAVERLLAQPPAHAAYKFRRKSFLMGRFMRYGGWYHYLPNLVRRDAARYEGDVHERPVVQGTIGVLEADIEHHPCEDLAAFISRHNRYTSIQAAEWFRGSEGRAASRTGLALALVHRPWKTFWKTYVKKRGYKEGAHGFLFAFLYAWIELVKWAKCWEALGAASAASGPARRGLGERAGLALLAGAAYALTVWAGARGFMPWDQSFVFDGGYRLLSGQVPYKDFVAPFGLTTFALQALSFNIWGVRYAAHLIPAGLLNAAAAVLATGIVQWCFPARRWLGWIAGLLTAVWCYPPFGTLYPEQTGFCLTLAAAACTVTALGRRPVPAAAWCAVSGALMAAVWLCKPNVGTLLLPLCPLLYAAGTRPRMADAWRGTGSFAAGLLAAAGVFGAWLVVASEPSLFLRYAVEVPSALGWERVWKHGFSGLARAILVGIGPRDIRPVVIAADLAAFAALWRLRRRPAGEGGNRQAAAAVACAYLVHFQHLFTYTAMNQSVYAMGFLGVIVALGTGLGFWVIEGVGRLPSSRRRAAQAWTATALVAGVWLGGRGVAVAASRDVHETVAGASFGVALAHPALRPLRWGAPTRIEGRDVEAGEVVELLEELTARGTPFFIFPDFLWYYGLTGQPSPQPLLWFGKGVTYVREGDPALDAWIVRALERHRIELVILEAAASGGAGIAGGRLDDFPQLRDYLARTFRTERRIGIFDVRRRRGT
jgi:hypothetical protein